MNLLATAAWLAGFFIVTFGALLLAAWISDRMGLE